MKTYQEIREKHLSDLEKSSSGGMFLFVAVLVFAAIIVALSLFNTISMQSVSTENAKEYVNELTLRTARTVSTDVNDKKNDLSSIADSLRLHLDDGIEETNTDEYLTTHLETLYEETKFDFLIFQHSDAQIVQFSSVSIDLPSVLESSVVAIEEAEQKGECIAYIETNYVLYVCPVYSSGQIEGTLIAGSSNSSLSANMQSHFYKNTSSYCVTNREGKLLIAAGDSRLSEAAEMLNPANTEKQDLIHQLESDFASGTNGVVEIELTDSQNYLLSYAPIDNEDWMLVTFIPVNVFSSDYIAYMKRALGLTVGAAIMFVVLVGLVVASYRGARKKLEYVAYTDELTGGTNDADFQLHYAALERRANPVEYSVAMLDINDFKLINELGGFEAGDRLLKRVYDAIISVLNEKDEEFACRVEVDHYFVCMHENTLEGIEARIAQIEDCINAAGQDITQGLHITFGKGVCIIDDAKLGVEEVTQRARIAKRSATPKERSKCMVYTEEMRHAISQKVQLDYMAEESIKNGDFVVYYQPKVDATTTKIKGAEALVRWNHPNRGLISPDDFVPVLEESGRIQDVDRCVFENTCRYLSERKAKGEELFPISVNLSRIHFWKDDPISEFVAIADAYQIDHKLLEFEITETVFMEQDKLEKIKAGIQKMHEQGFTCALDDFGVGYSSLSFVNQMDVDTLKFDRSFFANLDDEKSSKVLTSLLLMGDNLNLHMVAEGIETQSQIDFLRSTQACVIQGYYFSKPLPEADFEVWANEHL